MLRKLETCYSKPETSPIPMELDFATNRDE